MHGAMKQNCSSIFLHMLGTVGNFSSYSLLLAVIEY